jgi:hypothetical protein
MPSLPNMGFSACGTPMIRLVSPLEGKTIDWRAGCGRSARPVRGEGDRIQSVLPTPIISRGTSNGYMGPGFRPDTAVRVQGGWAASAGGQLASVRP